MKHSIRQRAAFGLILFAGACAPEKDNSKAKSGPASVSSTVEEQQSADATENAKGSDPRDQELSDRLALVEGELDKKASADAQVDSSSADKTEGLVSKDVIEVIVALKALALEHVCKLDKSMFDAIKEKIKALAAMPDGAEKDAKRDELLKEIDAIHEKMGDQLVAFKQCMMEHHEEFSDIRRAQRKVIGECIMHPLKDRLRAFKKDLMSSEAATADEIASAADALKSTEPLPKSEECTEKLADANKLIEEMKKAEGQEKKDDAADKKAPEEGKPADSGLSSLFGAGGR